MAESNTAEADMSFTFFITKLKSGQTRSHSFSMAEFIISKLSTTAKHNKMIAHSNDESPRKKPAITTIMASAYCMRKFFSWRMQSFKPLKAQPKDFITRIVRF